MIRRKSNKKKHNSLEDKFNINRINVLKILLIFEFILIIGKLFFIQVVNHDYYIAEADIYQNENNIIHASRGEIYLLPDQHNDINALIDPNNNINLNNLNKIVSNIYKYNLIADPASISDFDTMSRYLSSILKADSNLIHNKLVEVNNINSLTEKILELAFPDIYKYKVDEDRQNSFEAQKKDLEYIINTTKYKSTKTKNQQKLNQLLSEYKFDDETLKGIETLKTERLKLIEKLGKVNDRYEIIQKNLNEDTKNNITNYLSSLYLEAFKSFIDYSDKSSAEVKENQLIDFFNRFFSFETEDARLYADGNLFGQITGFLGQNDKGNKIGQYGIEGYYEKELKGIDGEIRGKYDASGKLIATSQRYLKEAKDGNDIILTIDRSIQYMACKILEEGVKQYGAQDGSISVMNPNTGEVLAMCNYPNFDPNKYSEVEDIRVYQNPIVADQIEFGSIFKAITMSAGIDSGAVTPETRYNDTGCIKEPDWQKQICNANSSTYSTGRSTTVLEALEKSLNVGAYFVAKQVGGKKYKEYVTNFGFGQKTGIEDLNEAKGDIRNLDKTEYKKGGSLYLANASFGQGIAITQIQFMSAFSAIINGGKLIKPHLTKAIVDNGKIKVIEPEVIRQVISEKSSTTMRGMLASVTEKGYSKAAQVPGYYIGGKTGTSQLAENGIYTDKTMQSFIGFGPVSDPKFVAMIKLNNPETAFASTSCTPMFSKLAQFLFDYYQIPPDRK
ncbi:MAG TPA: penicillin-binding protein 2 [bacterium]|nr:penicillin-binding protein 2 [bacterium]